MHVNECGALHKICLIVLPVCAFNWYLLPYNNSYSLWYIRTNSDSFTLMMVGH